MSELTGVDHPPLHPEYSASTERHLYDDGASTAMIPSSPNEPSSVPPSQPAPAAASSSSDAPRVTGVMLTEYKKRLEVFLSTISKDDVPFSDMINLRKEYGCLISNWKSIKSDLSNERNDKTAFLESGIESLFIQINTQFEVLRSGSHSQSSRAAAPVAKSALPTTAVVASSAQDLERLKVLEQVVEKNVCIAVRGETGGMSATLLSEMVDKVSRGGQDLNRDLIQQVARDILLLQAIVDKQLLTPAQEVRITVLLKKYPSMGSV